MPDKYNISYLKQYLLHNFNMKMDINLLKISKARIQKNSNLSEINKNDKITISIGDDEIIEEDMIIWILRNDKIEPLTCQPYPGG
jgi:Trk K+ transport system NAD-binding subunit